MKIQLFKTSAQGFYVNCKILLPAKLTIFPSPQVNLAVARPPAHVGGGCLVLDGPPEERPAAEAGHRPVVDVLGGGLVADLQM